MKRYNVKNCVACGHHASLVGHQSGDYVKASAARAESDERAACIVAWLRRQGVTPMRKLFADEFADRIERGEVRTGQSSLPGGGYHGE